MLSVLERIEKGDSELIKTGIWSGKETNQVHKVDKDFYLVNLVDTSQGIDFSGECTKLKGKQLKGL